MTLVEDLNPDYWGRCRVCVKETMDRLATDMKNTAVRGEWSRNAATQAKDNADTFQPLNKDGTINKKFVAVHGTKRIEKETKMTQREIREEAERYS